MGRRGRLVGISFVLVVLLVGALAPASALGHGGSASPPLAVPEAPAPLTITSFVASPSTFVISAPTWFNVTVAGGVPPYSYYYSGLPPGCLSVDNDSDPCVPREVHSFTVEVTVNDSNGSHVSSTVEITVTSGYRGPPVIESVVITPDPVALGQVATITINAVSVSNSTLGYFYFDLPPGCYSFNQTPLQCLPHAPGSYRIGLQVVDGFGEPVQAHAYLNVTGSSPTASDHPGALPTFLLYGVPVVVVALALLVAAVLFGRRGRQGPPKAYIVPPKP